MAEPGFSGALACRCGKVRMRLKRPPLARYYCHCMICQEVYGRPFGDATVAWRFALEIEDPALVVFRRQRSIPFSVRCGTCRFCAGPVVGYTALLPFLDLALLPAHTYRNPADVPAAVGHIFYDSRVGDVADDLPKYGGFLASEWGFARFVLTGLARPGTRPSGAAGA